MSSTPSARRPRILYFLVQYPQFSETYMHEELRAVREFCDVRVITYSVARDPRREPFPYDVIKLKGECLQFGNFARIDPEFNAPEQQEFLRGVCAAVDEFKPDLIHAHWFGVALLLRKLAERYRIPFTMRTHSQDMLNEPAAKIAALVKAVNSPWCRGLIVFPAFRPLMIAAGVRAEKVTACWPTIHYARFHRPEKRPPTRRVLCSGPAILKKAHHELVDLAVRMRGSGWSFDLYARGPSLELTRAHNARAGNPVNIRYVDPDEMPQIYPQYDWLVYPGDLRINKVGLPVSIAEAQAAGVGVCWQEMPRRREEQLEFLGGAGFVFRSIAEVPAILAQPYPEEMRLRALDNARKCDLARTGELLARVWGEALQQPAAACR
jgi:glycosyltransferase involved in cell wall biosynthesis